MQIFVFFPDAAKVGVKDIKVRVSVSLRVLVVNSSAGS